MFNSISCILCLESSNEQVELDSEEGQNLNSKKIIEQHFKEELLMISQMEMRVVCRKCWQLVQSFHEFYLQVQQVHREAAITLKNGIFEKENSDNKAIYKPVQNTPSRRRGRPKRLKTEKACDVICNTTLPLKECEVKIEELLLPSSCNIGNNCPHLQCTVQSDLLPGTKIKEETFLKEELVDVNSLLGSSDSNEMESENKTQRKVLPEKQKSKSVNKNKSNSNDYIEKKRKAGNKKTAESDEYIAEKNFKFSCSICHISLANFKELKGHFRLEHKIRGYVLCCGKKLPERCLLIDHIRLHEDPEYFKCKYCGKTMSERRSLDLHLQYKHGNQERIHRCSICSKAFFRASCLKQHSYMHIADEAKTVPCSKCDKTFPDDVELRKHMRQTHLNAYAKICDICGVSMKSRFSFERHQAEHAGVPRKLIKCDLCDAVLTTKYGLARHIKTMHTEEFQTPQVCPICSKVSPSLQAHKNHIKYMHSLQRKHECKLCDKAFKRLTDFKEHMATHTGEALYTCSFCPQTFKSNANMYSHRKKKHLKEWAKLCAAKKNFAVSAKEASTSYV